MMLLLYVDNILISRQDPKLIRKLKKLSSVLYIKIWGTLDRSWGCKWHVTWIPRSYGCLCKNILRSYLKGLKWNKLRKLALFLVVSSSLARNVILLLVKIKRRWKVFLTTGSLMYVMVCIRSDIAQTVGVVSRFLFSP